MDGRLASSTGDRAGPDAATPRREVLVGIDLAWSTGWTGVAVVDETGRLLDSGRVRTDDEIDAWLGSLPGHPRVVAVDAPLVVPNDTGQRRAEREIGRAYSAFGASAHSTNRTLLGGQPRAMRLAERFGWDVDPHLRRDDQTTTCVEVYPHPALVGLFGLPYRLAYKKGDAAQRLVGFRRLADLLESVTPLDLPSSPRWAHIRRTLDSPRPGDLDRHEDEMDALLCAHLAWLWRHHPAALHVYGSPQDGCIVAPPPPSHPAVRPPPAAPSGSR